MSDNVLKIPVSQGGEGGGATPTEITTGSASSNYLRYLSNMEMGEDSDISDKDEMYWSITTKCLLYLKREQENINTELHDMLILSVFSHHFNLDQLLPTPVSFVGARLMDNGYFLAAFALFRLRKRYSDYTFLYFKGNYQKLGVGVGKQELFFHLSLMEQKMSEQTKKKNDLDAEKPVKRSGVQTRSSRDKDRADVRK